LTRNSDPIKSTDYTGYTCATGTGSTQVQQDEFLPGWAGRISFMKLLKTRLRKVWS